MKFVILTRSDFRSPRILAESLKLQLEQHGQSVEVFCDLSLLNRMVSSRESKLSFHFWLKRKLKYFISDRRLIKKIKQFDAVIISECIPNGFLRRLYDVEKFKRIIKKPVGLYEVYYLGNAPTQIQKLRENKNALLQRYDFHLSVSNLTEIKKSKQDNWFSVGIKANSWNLQPSPKKEIIAIIDFLQPGYERYRETQISALRKTGIKYISLEGRYTVEEIRSIYQQTSLLFIQFPEAFGLPILECLCAGCQIFTPESWWPMSWRLNENPEVHSPGRLPECFSVYETEEDLTQQLNIFRNNFDTVVTPQRVFDNFLSYYPEFYSGDDEEVKRCIEYLKEIIESN